MITTQQAVRALEEVRKRPDLVDVDRALALGLESVIWQLLREEKKFEEISAVLHGISRTLDRLKYELIKDHNRDVDAISASLEAMRDLVVSMRRAL